MPSHSRALPSPRRAASFALFGAIVVLVAPPARADRRAFTHTYQYMTMPRGDTELEIYSTQARGEGDNPPQSFELQLEIEHGITDRWDVSLYHVFAQESVPGGESTPLHFAELKGRTRYRLAERGELPVDTLLYGEVAKEFGESKWELEGKLILARDVGPVTAVANLVAEVEIEKEAGEGRHAHFIPAWAAGVVYEASPRFTVGAETFGELEPEGDERELVLAAGPAVSWAPSPSFWIASTLAFGIEHAAELELRAIIGLHI
jgi:hypothetical protein